MLVDSSSCRKLAGIRPAPLCREDDNRALTLRAVASASSLPSLARLGMFKRANDSKSRFINKHMKAATAAALATETVPAELPSPWQWNGPTSTANVRVSEPLAVMATQNGLEDYRRRKRAGERDADAGGKPSRQRARYERHAPLLGEDRYHRPRRQPNKRTAPVTEAAGLAASSGETEAQPRRHPQQQGVRQARRTTASRHPPSRGAPPAFPPPEGQSWPRNRGEEPSNSRRKQPSAHIVKLLPQGGSVLIRADGVRKSQFPRGCEPPVWMERVAVGGCDRREPGCAAGALSKWEESLVTRLCDPKAFTGTAATGRLPVTVDLEGGAGILLKDAPITVKDHVGLQEMSWRLRLAERL